jgi:hypothetical protein
MDADDDGRELDEFIDRARTSQRNTVFPDTVRNSRSVDAFLWRGSPNPSLVQRVGAWLFGLTEIGIGLCAIPLAIQGLHGEDHPWIAFAIFMLMATAMCLLGIRTFRNGFPRRQKQGSN